MKALRMALTLLVVLSLVIGYTYDAYAKTAYIASHVTIQVVPPPEESSVPGDEEMANFGMKDGEMTTRIDSVERIKGTQSVYTMVGVL